MRRVKGLRMDRILRLKDFFEELDPYLCGVQTSQVGLQILRKKIAEILEQVPESSEGRERIEHLVYYLQDIENRDQMMEIIAELNALYRMASVRFVRTD